ncbi:MAG: flagellar assembly protein FliW [Candidatus Hydrogenedentes bacterium]|nr:flagellar assembly protein FliW [Candidatus Hydrogenedentota bacterium]
MKVETTRFGTVEVDDADVLTFTQPILGFADCTRYIIVKGPAGKSGINWLQSVTRPEVAFLVMDPMQVVPDYEVRLPANQVEDLELRDETEAVLLTLVVVPANKSEVRTNLRAPIIYNPRRKLAKQVVLYDTEYPVRFYLRRDVREAKARDEGSGEDAGSNQKN